MLGPRSRNERGPTWWRLRPLGSRIATSRRRGPRAVPTTRYSRSRSALRSARPRGNTILRRPPSPWLFGGPEMRLAILDRGHGLGAKALFAIIRLASGHPAPDIVKLLKYRSDFFGAPMSKFIQEAMRGASKWSVGDRE